MIANIGLGCGIVVTCTVAAHSDHSSWTLHSIWRGAGVHRATGRGVLHLQYIVCDMGALEGNITASPLVKAPSSRYMRLDPSD